MPAISSNTLFHFTKKGSLLGILENEFYPKLSLEYYQIDKTTSFKYGLPMVSFCDIPLSMVFKHTTKYGNYGIGMSMEWAERNRLNPVLYLRKGSETTEIIKDVFTGIGRYLENINKVGVEVKPITEWLELLLKLFTFTKPFDCIADGGEILKYYDERERRYVPDPSSYGGKQIMLLENQFKDLLLSEENKKLKKARLHFEPNDINYIIIKEESERLDLINEISRIKKRFDGNTIRILQSKIISAEQICQDF